MNKTMANEKNYLFGYYATLGCNKQSTYDELKRAYKKMALLYHPDKNHENKSGKTADNEKFFAIEEAWRILSDDKLRNKYDAECRQAELEAENVLIYDKINVKHLRDIEEGADRENYLCYPCRCGSNYMINKNDVEELGDEAVHIQCQECTFSIILEK